MGYITTVLGYGANHMDLPINLLFKKVVKHHEGPEEAIQIAETDDLYRLVLESPIELSLQDDIVYPADLETRDFIVETEDDVFELLHNQFKSKEYGCMVGQAGPCFRGIIIADSDQEDIDVEENMLAAKKWASELKIQGRFPQDAKLVMADNCCS